jgi:hypothetical protein
VIQAVQASTLEMNDERSNSARMDVREIVA